MNSRPGHAMQVIGGLHRGGAERMLVRSVLGLRDLGWRVSVVSLRDGPLRPELEAADIPLHDLAITRRGVVASARSLMTIIRRDRPEVLHSWMFHANIPTRIAGRILGVPLVVSSEHTLQQESRRRYFANRITGRLPHVHVCVSRAVAGFARRRIRLPPDRLVVIRNGIETDEFRPVEDRAAIRFRLGLPPNRLLIGSVAQLKAVKRVDVLLHAFARLERPVELALVGEGVERRGLEDLARRLGIADRVHFCGEQADPATWFHAFDVFASASDVEGLPVAILEAMAAGLPVVATRVGGTEEVVEDGVTGLLVQPRDPTALALALDEIFDDPQRAAEMGAGGRERVRSEFEARRMVAEIDELYVSRLENRT